MTHFCEPHLLTHVPLGLPYGSLTTPKNKGFFDVFDVGGTESCTLLAFSAVAEHLADPDVQFIIASWAKLPDSIKAGILSIIGGSTHQLEPNNRIIGSFG